MCVDGMVFYRFATIVGSIVSCYNTDTHQRPRAQTAKGSIKSHTKESIGQKKNTKTTKNKAKTEKKKTQ